MTSIEGCGLAWFAIEEARSEVDLAALVAEHAATLFRVAHSVLRSRTEAEDVVQDAMVRVLQHRGTLREVKDLRVWLIRIAWNLALDRRRRVRPDQMDAGFAEALAGRTTPADEAIEESRRMQRVLAEMDRLPRAERDALLLSAVEELGTAEIGIVLGRTESAVRALLFRARARLRARLEAKGGV